MSSSTVLRLALAGALVLPVLPATSGDVAAQSRCGDVWRISPGDTLSSISRICGVPIGALQAANPQIDWRRLPVGARINLNVRGGVVTPAPIGPARPDAYIVRPGDTLSSIARAFGISLQALLTANPGIGDRDLQVGRVVYFAGRPGGGRPPVDRPVPLPTPIQVDVDTRDAEPGGFADVRVSGLRPGARVAVEAGPVDGRGGSEGSGRANRNGNAGVELEIPRRARPGDRWSYEVYDEGNRLLADGSFRLGGRPGGPGGPVGPGGPGGPGGERVSITGTISNEGAECPAIRADNGRLYTLAGGPSGFRPGDRVTITGEVAERSTCMQGTTIAVASIRPAR